MEDFIDHYTVLGLPSGEEGAKLSNVEIAKAYRSKALELHPDKRPDDPDAHQKFHRLHESYEFLKDDKARKLLDDILIFRVYYQKRLSQLDLKGCKMNSVQRPVSPSPPDNENEEKAAAKQLRVQIDKLRLQTAKIRLELYE